MQENVLSGQAPTRQLDGAREGLGGANLVTLIADRLRRTAERPALTLIGRSSAETCSGTQLLGMTAAAAAAIDRLVSRPAARNDAAEEAVIPIVATHCAEVVAFFLACIHRGYCPTYMPYPTSKQDPEHYWNSHATLFDRIQPICVLAEAEIVASAHGAGAATGMNRFRWEVLPTLDRVAAEPLGEAAIGGNRVALLQHSSGTTSLKKGVMLTHAQIVAQVDAYAASVGLNERSTVVSWLPLYHDMGLIACLLTPLLTGCHIAMMDPFDWVAKPHTLLDWLDKFEDAFAWLPNFAFDHIARLPVRRPTKLAGVKALISCSEVTKSATLARFSRKVLGAEQIDPRLQVCYALAENVFAVSQTPVGSIVRTRGDAVSCGRILDNVSVRIVGDDGCDVDAGETGEVWLKGECVTPGYFRRPDLNETRFKDGWFLTNDLGFVDDGELFVLGRRDDMIISYGRNYFAHEIESIVSGLTGGRPGRAVAFGIPRPEASGPM